MKKGMALLITSAILCSSPAFSYFDLQGELKKYEDENNQYNAEGSVFVPLLLDNEKSVFVDIRGGIDHINSDVEYWKSEKRLSAGLGTRSLLSGENIVGGYAFYDQLKPKDFRFHQISGGIEVLNPKWEVRANGYFPIKDKEYDTTLEQYLGNVSVHSIVKLDKVGEPFIDIPQSYRYAMQGFDAEAAYKINHLGLTFYGGGYYFKSHRGHSTKGPRLRARFSKSISDFATFNFYALFQKDEINGSQISGVANIRIPFGKTKLEQGSQQAKQLLISKIERMPGINTMLDHNRNDKLSVKITSYDVGGNHYSKVNIIDANANIADEVKKAGKGEFILVDGSKGDIKADKTIEMQEGQVLQGVSQDAINQDFIAEVSGIKFKAKFDSSLDLKPAKILAGENFEGGKPLVQIANKANIKNLELELDKPATDKSETAVITSQSDAVLENARIEGNTITSKCYNCTAIKLGDAKDSSARHNVITIKDSRGIHIAPTQSGGFEKNDMHHNKIMTTGTWSHGIWFATPNEVKNNVIQSNEIKTADDHSSGINFLPYGGLAVGNTIDKNIITTSGNESFAIWFNGLEEGRFENNTIINNKIKTDGKDAQAIRFTTKNNSKSDANQIVANTITTTGYNASGIDLNGNESGSISNNNIKNNKIDVGASYGIMANSRKDGAGVFDKNIISKNTINTDGDEGDAVRLDTEKAKSVSDNKITGNTLETKKRDSNGIVLYGAKNSIVDGNTITTHANASEALTLWKALGTKFANNNITIKDEGTFVLWLYNDENTFTSDSKNNTKTGGTCSTGANTKDGSKVYFTDGSSCPSA